MCKNNNFYKINHKNVFNLVKVGIDVTLKPTAFSLMNSPTPLPHRESAYEILINPAVGNKCKTMI